MKSRKLNAFIMNVIMLIPVRLVISSTIIHERRSFTKAQKNEGILQRTNLSSQKSSPMLQLKRGMTRSFITSLMDTINYLDINKYMNDLFDKADVDHNGSISFDEVYEFVLLTYIKVNRKAPIPPPSRNKIKELFQKFDVDNNGRLKRDEFRQLVIVGLSKTSIKLLSHKLLTFFAAPMLACKVVNYFPQKSWVGETVIGWTPEKYVETVSTVSNWKMGLTVFFVATLGNTVISCVEYIFDVIAFR